MNKKCVIVGIALVLISVSLVPAGAQVPRQSQSFRPIDGQGSRDGPYNLTLTTSGTGAGTIEATPGPYNNGTIVTIWANASTGSTFAGFSGDLNGTASPQILLMDGNKTVDAQFTLQEGFTLTIVLQGSGTVLKDPDLVLYPDGQVVNLTALPTTGWSFNHWEGNLTGNINPTNITMTENKTVIANFSQDQYTLSVTVEGLGNVTKDPDQALYTYGQNVTLTAVSDLGWSLNHWAGDLTGNTTPATIVMDGNTSIIANFTQDHYTLTLTIEGQGNVTKDPDQATYLYGQVVNLTATPAIGWIFDYWAGDLTGNTTPATIVMDGDKSIIANFTQIHYLLTITVEGQGNVTKDPEQPWYSYGQLVNVTAIAAHHWIFNMWGGDLNGTQNPANITIVGNSSIIANFTFTNAPPVANNDSYRTLNNVPLFVAAPGVLGNDTDSDGDTLTAVLVNGTQGTLNLSSDGSFAYQPPPGFNGVDVFTYQAFDGFAYSTVATVTIIVQNESAPEKPLPPAGPAVGKTIEAYRFNVTTTDPDEDPVYYQWNWGDGNISDWLGPFPSGNTTSLPHQWESMGFYNITVRAKDRYNFTSNWSDPFTITMLQPTVIVGLISNVTKGDNYTTFDPELTIALTLPKITMPIKGPGHMLVSNERLGILRKLIIIGYFYAVWIPDR